MKIGHLFESQSEQFIAILRDFFPVAMKELGIDSLPKIKLVKRLPKGHQPTFGKFVNEEGVIYLAIEDRHPIDVVRTLAHELVHFKQGVEHELGPHSGDTGSEIENEAHEVAGVIMRHFDLKFPKYFKLSAINIKEDAVDDLEKDLKHPHSYDAIDHMMKSIAKQHSISPKKLHDLFVKKHGKIPDEWIKK